MAIFDPIPFEPAVKSPFRTQLEVDDVRVFLNPEEFGQLRTLRYEGEVYEDVPLMLDEGLEANHHNFKIMKTDHSKGLWKETVCLYCRRKSLGGKKPEVDDALELESKVRRGFWLKYNVEESSCEEGLLKLLLKKVEE